MTPRAKTVATSVAVALLFALPLLPEILGTRVLVFRDAQITHWPWRRVAMEALASGHVPFVNARASGGQPLLANPNAVLLYPTMLLERLLSPVSAFNLHYLLHVIWAFLGARLLAERLRISPGGATFAGVTYAFSGVMLSYASAFMNSSGAAAWLPWCAAAAVGLARSRDWPQAGRSAAACGLAFGLQLLAGEPAVSALTGVFVLFLCLLELFLRPAEERAETFRKLAGGGAATVAIAFAFSAPLILPLRAVFPLTYRGQHLYSKSAFGAAPFTLSRVIEWFFPRFGGDPAVPGSGASWMHSIHDQQLVYIWCVTLGTIALCAVFAAAIRRSFWNERTISLAIAALVAWLLSFGFGLPFYRLVYAVEFLRRLRYPIKFYLLTTIAFSLLAGLAADSLQQRNGRRREIFLMGSLAAVYGMALLLASSGDWLDRFLAPGLIQGSLSAADMLAAFHRSIRMDAILGILACSLLIFLLALRRPVRIGLALGLAAVLFALPWGLPLFVSASAHGMARPPALLAAVQGTGRLFASPATPAPDLATTGGWASGLPRYENIARAQIEELVPATGETFGITYLFDHDPDGSYGFYNRLANEASDSSSEIERSRLLRIYGARWALSGKGESFPLFHPITGVLVAGQDLVLHGIDAPVAEIRWVGRPYRRSSLSAALALLRSDRFDPLTDVVLPAASDGDPSEEDRGPAGDLAVSNISSDAVAGAVNAPKRGWVVFSRTYFGAWRARVDGQAARLLVANAREIALPVPPGRHEFEIAWDRRPFHRGVVLQGATLGLILCLGLGLARRPRSAPPPDPSKTASI